MFTLLCTNQQLYSFGWLSNNRSFTLCHSSNDITNIRSVKLRCKQININFL